MEDSTNHTYNHVHSHSETQLHRKILYSDSFLLIIIPITIFLILLAITLTILLLRRLKSAAQSAISKENGRTSTRLIAHTTINVSFSPDVNGGGCLNKGSQGRTAQSRLKGVQVFTYRELEAATEKFHERNVIWREGKGEVYRGILSDGTVAAIKALHHREGKHRERAFRMEVDLLSRLHSPCLVELLGYCADQNHRLLVFEFTQNGTLQASLHPHPRKTLSQPLDWGTRLRIALDCAMALEFLHEQATPTVIHRDFKCSNVFLDRNFRAKVSGFGSAKMGSDKINTQMSTNMPGTSGYLAPEYASTGKLTTKSDVYSYGVVLLELFTGRMPVDMNRPPGQRVLVSWALPRLTNREKVMEMVDPSLQGQCPKKDLIQIAAIAAMCVQPEADYRPLMTDVVQSLIPLVKTPSSMASSTSSRFLIHQPSPRY